MQAELEGLSFPHPSVCLFSVLSHNEKECVGV